MRGPMAPPPWRRFPYRDGVQPLCNGCIFLRGVAYHNRREPQEIEADITDIWNTITPFNKMHLFATLFRR